MLPFAVGKRCRRLEDRGTAELRARVVLTFSTRAAGSLIPSVRAGGFRGLGEMVGCHPSYMRR